MISLRPSLTTEHHSVSSLNDLAREASPSSRYLRRARDEDTTYTVGGNCSRVDGDKRTDDIETRSYSPDASVDLSDARKATVRRFGRSDRSALRNGRKPAWYTQLMATGGQSLRHRITLEERGIGIEAVDLLPKFGQPLQPPASGEDRVRTSSLRGGREFRRVQAQTDDDRV